MLKHSHKHCIHLFRENLTGALYSKILEWYLQSQAEVFHKNRWFLVEDNDPKHTSKVVKKFMEENMPNRLLDWPSQSPDMNPIENLFSWIKYQLNRLPHRRPKSISSLNKIWDGISPEFLENY